MNQSFDGKAIVLYTINATGGLLLTFYASFSYLTLSSEGFHGRGTESLNNLILETVGEAGSHEILVHCCREYKLAHPFQRTIWKQFIRRGAFLLLSKLHSHECALEKVLPSCAGRQDGTVKDPIAMQQTTPDFMV